MSLPPNAALVRALLTAKMYDEAADELRYAQSIWGDSGPIEATFAWTYRQQGQTETGSRQFSLYRGSINAMKRAYPQYLTAGGERLPREILRIIYPIAYWDLIQKYSAQNGLDPFLVAALMCQESTFVANIRSPAKAVGLMQLDAADRAAVCAGASASRIRRRVLTTPELNIRIAHGVPRPISCASTAAVSACSPPTTPATAACAAGCPSGPDCRRKSSSTTSRSTRRRGTSGRFSRPPRTIAGCMAARLACRRTTRFHRGADGRRVRCRSDAENQEEAGDPASGQTRDARVVAGAGPRPRQEAKTARRSILSSTPLSESLCPNSRVEEGAAVH